MLRESGGRAVRILESGSQVLEAEWSDGSRWAAGVGQTLGRVTDRGKPVAGAHVLVLGTTISTLTDSAGRFVFRALLPGRYAISATDSSVSGFHNDPPNRQIVSVDAARVDDISLDWLPAQGLLRSLCPRTPASYRHAALLGWGVGPDGEPVADADIRAAFGYDEEQKAQNSIPVRRTNAMGRFVVCALVLGREVRLLVSRDGRAIADTAVHMHDAYQRVDLRLRGLVPDR